MLSETRFESIEDLCDIQLIAALTDKDGKAVQDVCECVMSFSKDNYKNAEHFSYILLGTIFRLGLQPYTPEVEEIIHTMVHTATKVNILQFEG
jgi:hypothetical protein